MTRTIGTRMINKSTGKGRICLVTGSASQGMGREDIKLMAQEGAVVAVSDIPSRENEGRELVKELEDTGTKAIWVPLDVTSEEDWEKAIEHGVLDVLVNNAGIGGPSEPAVGGIENLSLEDWRKTQRVNTEGVFLGHKYAIKSMKTNTAQEACSIVNISSRAGLSGGGFLVSYSASKWAVRGMTKSFAAYCSEKGYKIRVNSVHPGVIITDMTRGVWFDKEDKPIHNAIEGASLLKRSAEAKEVANLVLYLASDESSYSNASEFIVDGGWKS
ncbi:NAD(P)-binding protein [Gonapodya prolifera JEL478]|uniref:NAD(P)-binding protein n=1 Tax=Gonapodya prolifera (strain JEL478) TaxID=1344416 RepID=A0A139AG85_GONPJ|nr:NAD(P)-binding protein [Gonapodya prolifera JEL478]|eukprot:KXS15768.1 NAD(P)-binding protein [Gonapodya prolifera JEL478]